MDDLLNCIVLNNESIQSNIKNNRVNRIIPSLNLVGMFSKTK